MARCKVQIIRQPGVGDVDKPVYVFMNENKVFDLAPNELKAVFRDEPSVQVDVRQGNSSLLQGRVDLVSDHRIKLSLQNAARGGLFGWLSTQTTILIELERAALPPRTPSSPLPPKLITQQMWFGHADTADALYRLMEERAAYYSDNNFEAEGTADHIALSEFADLMGQNSYDHDFLEVSFAQPGDTLEAKFQCSWVGQWAPVVREKVPEAVWRDANAMIMLVVDDYKGRKTAQIRKPVDVMAEGIRLTYVGEIAHPDQ